ncbi:hypothetical protein LguiB_018320 [Lonicera macranthoides]
MIPQIHFYNFNQSCLWGSSLHSSFVQSITYLQYFFKRSKLTDEFNYCPSISKRRAAPPDNTLTKI